jgi:hypothetical protein
LLKRKSEKTTQLQKQLGSLMAELARYLLASGISFKEFQSAAQTGFVDAAAEVARLRNTRVNQSAIAAMTGLTRNQVRALLAKPMESLRRQPVNRLDQLIVGWTTDSRFITASHEPVALDLRASSKSFSALAKKYGADIPPRALLSELKRRKLVVVTKDSVRLLVANIETRAERELRQLSQALCVALRPADVAQTRRSTKSAAAQISYRALSPVGQVLLRRRVKQGLDALMRDLQSAVEAASQSGGPEKKRSNRMSKLSVILLTQE